MNRILKKTAVVILLVVAVLTVGGSIVSCFFRDDVIRFAVESINEHVNSRIQVQSAHFSVIRKFPNASVEFRNVTMSPARDFDTLSFDTAYSRRLLEAESVFAELNLLRLLTGNFSITRIEIQNGKINMLTDGNNRHNFIFWKTKTTGNNSASIELQNVSLNNVEVYYGHKRGNTAISLYARKAYLSGKFASRRYSLGADWLGTVQLLSIGNDVYIRDKTMELSGKLNVSDTLFTIRKSDLSLAQLQMNVSGGFTAGKTVDLDLNFEGKHLDYASFVSLLPEPYGKQLNDYPGRGIFSFSADVKGIAGNGRRPGIEAKFGIEKGQITHRKSNIKLSGLSFSGSFSTGGKNLRSTSSLHIRNFGCTMGGDAVKGSLLIQNFVKPHITVKVNGNTDLNQLYRFFPAREIASAGGKVNGEISATARLKRLSANKPEDFDRLDVQGSLKFDNASVALNRHSYRINRINGTLQLGNRIATKDLSFVLNGNDFKVNGYMEQLVPYMLKRSKTMHINANAVARKLCIDSLLQTSAMVTGKAAANKKTENTALQLPRNVTFETNLDITKFQYGKFEADHLKTSFTYQPKVLSVRSIGFSSMSGKVSGSGTVANDNADNLIILGETMLSRIEIRNLFHTFGNFGQDVLRAEHLNGQLSGDMGFAVSWDRRMLLRKNEIKADGRLDLTDGELVNFEPMNNLSRFVALEELQNIRFSTLRTQVSASNGKLTFPQTDIKTSAFDILGAGEHYFDNSYTYQVKILLSELLAAKARKAKRENIENEYVEDGGKRTALYLKIAGKDTDFKISYDKQSARASIAADIRNERQTLKSILKEEFGLFKKDSTVKSAAPANTGKLRFSFDDEPQKNDTEPKNDKKSGRKKQDTEEDTIKVDWK